MKGWMSAVLLVALAGCGQPPASSHGDPHHGAAGHAGGHDGHQAPLIRPTNEVAVVTVWAEAGEVAATGKFYEDVLGLRRVGGDAEHVILDTDGTFVVIMAGRLEHPRGTKRRWPLFALTVPDLDASVKSLRDEGVELPWGIEEFGAPEPSSRYVMFKDPAGNLVEVVEWL